MSSGSLSMGVHEIRLERQEVIRELSRLLHTMWQEQMRRIVGRLETTSDITPIVQTWKRVCNAGFDEITEWRNAFYVDQSNRVLNVLDAMADLQRARSSSVLSERMPCEACGMLGAVFTECSNCGGVCCDNCMNLAGGRAVCANCYREQQSDATATRETIVSPETSAPTDVPEPDSVRPELTRPATNKMPPHIAQAMVEQQEREEEEIRLKNIEKQCGLPDFDLDIPMPQVKRSKPVFRPKMVRRSRPVFEAFEQSAIERTGEKLNKTIESSDSEEQSNDRIVTTNDIKSIEGQLRSTGFSPESISKAIRFVPGEKLGEAVFTTDEDEAPVQDEDDDELLPSERWAKEQNNAHAEDQETSKKTKGQ